jgi:hypothetical protein
MVIQRVLSAAALALMTVFFGAQDRRPQPSPLSNWKPFQRVAGVRYVGSQVCARCHPAQASSQGATPMAHAMEAISDCEVLRANPKMTYSEGKFSYQVTRQGGAATYIVGDGTRSISAQILFCFGSGVAGQTWVFRHNGSFYESRVSYYSRLKGLDITIQHPRALPPTLEDAIGRRMTPEAAEGCFKCHSTDAVGDMGLKLDRLIPGVRCEACHGPGERHVAAASSGKPAAAQIFNPGRLDALDLMHEFCGACHQSFDQVAQMPDHGGINNVRFQPYRMLNSRGHLDNDKRLSCIACHNPHEHSRPEPEFYDSKCLSCHVTTPGEPKTAQRMAAACRVSKQSCVTCHMPKVELPEMHFKFTDHWIRIARPGDPVPR